MRQSYIEIDYRAKRIAFFCKCGDECELNDMKIFYNKVFL